MNLNTIKMMYQNHRMLFVIALIVAVLFLAGCASQNAPAPTSQFIGGGCGA